MPMFSVLLCLEFIHIATGSLLHRGRGTVAENRHAQMPATTEPPTIMGMSMGNDKPPAFVVSENSPESVTNVLDFQIPMPTPLPAAWNGVYCKGGACQFRVLPPAPTLPPPTMAPPNPPGMLADPNDPSGNSPLGGPPPGATIGGAATNGAAMELCRGLACLDGMGFPSDSKADAFSFNCMHLFQDVAGGMVGKDDSRTVPEVEQSFVNVCKKRVGPLEVGACPAYASVFYAAEAAKVDNPTVGGPIEVCHDTYMFIDKFKQAEIDLKLSMVTLPKGNSLLKTGIWRFGTGGNGPNSPRGLKWREFAWKHNKWPIPPAKAEQLDAEGGIIASALLQTKTSETKPKPLIRGQDQDADSPRGLPKYNQNAPCKGKDAEVVPQKQTMYQILPGAYMVPPTEVDGVLFTTCTSQFSEIMMGYAQTPYQVIKLTKDWCIWQSSVTSWVGAADEMGHPEWGHRTCTGMQGLVAYALKDDLSDTYHGLSGISVCKKIFLAIGAVHRADAIVADAWAVPGGAGRAPSSGVPAVDDAEMKKLMEAVQAHANKVFASLRGVKAAVSALTDAKMDTSAFDGASLPTAPALPDLPDSNDVDATSLLAVSVDRVRIHKRVTLPVSEELKSFGSADN